MRQRNIEKKMIEALCDIDDSIMEKYLSGEEITPEEIRAALRKGTIQMKITPVLCGSAFKNKGVQMLLDAIVYYLPSPLDIPPVKGVNPLDGTEIQRKPSIDEPLTAIAFKIMADPYMGSLTYVRVYSGILTSGSYVYNSTRNIKERVARIFRMHSNRREEIKEICAGDIAAVVGLKKIP